MNALIEDYGIIGNGRTVALVGRDGSIDWLCLPRFDAAAVFAALLGQAQNGRWLIAPAEPTGKSTHAYRADTAILETRFETDSGRATITDFMPLPGADEQIDLIRLVRGDAGLVRMRIEIILRFDYGRSVPWVRRRFGGLNAISGPNAVQFTSPVALRGTPELMTIGEFAVAAGEIVPFTMSWYPSHRQSFTYRDPIDALQATENWWHDWSAHCVLGGRWRDAIIRSLITLKLLIYEPTGGIVAAPTTSLPELLGGTRNWDYRYCWLRDATLALYALMTAGYRNEARAWREWLLRSAAGHPSELQIMYGIAGERRLTELKLDWLPGYGNSTPVRIGNAAYQQLQIDVFGELMDTLFACNRFGLEANDDAWNLQTELLNSLEQIWDKPDQGLWESRGEPQHYTFSKIMAWVAFDRAVKSIDQDGRQGPRERWDQLRGLICEEVIAKGFDRERNSFVQHYGGSELDASLLLIPQLGFLPPEDPRVIGTIEAIERDLVVDGLVMRYTASGLSDGLPAGEGAFLVCSFWLANSLALIGRQQDAVALFERLLTLRNDLGLLAEEYDPQAKRFLGNFPQAFSHMGIINTAAHLARIESASADRGADRTADPRYGVGEKSPASAK